MRKVWRISAVLFVFSIILGVGALSSSASAHRSGCHRWHSCPSDSGSYTCGDTGYSNYCGAQTYKAPVVTTKDEIVEESIPNTTKIQSNSNEYVGYKRVITEGRAGKRLVSTRVTYSNGAESFRGAPSTSVSEEAIDTVYEVGTRAKPTAFVDYIRKSDQQGFWSFLATKYDISASAPPNSDFALIKNDKVIKLGRSTKNGMLNFSGVALKGNDTLKIGTYKGGQFLWFMPSADPVSEPAIVNTEKASVISEYDKAHNKTSERTNEAKTVQECSQDISEQYLKTLDTTEKKLFDSQKSERIYYTEIPCDVKNVNYKV